MSFRTMQTFLGIPDEKRNLHPCDEQADIPGAEMYIQCGTETDGRKYRHKYSGEGPYCFCARHLDHNLRRGFEEVTDA